jgi:spore coat polysaccharide biosynthesis predicted glycosyltransferase SpsG
MRIATIAQEAISRGIECHFVGRISDLDWVSAYIQNLGFASIVGGEDSWIANCLEDVLLLDSYTTSLDSQYSNPRNWKLLVCIADGFTPDYPADIKIKQSLMKSVQESASNLFDGPDYVLIRKGIRKSCKGKSESSSTQILILGGGSDPFGFVHAALSQLSLIQGGFKIIVFSNEDLSKFGFLDIEQHQIGPELDVLAGEVDLVITTASTTSLEFIAREIPTLIVCAIDNQEKTYAELSELNYAMPVGLRNTQGEWQINRDAIRNAIENPQLREELKNRIRGVIDFRGPSRVVDEIEKFSVDHQMSS